MTPAQTLNTDAGAVLGLSGENGCGVGVDVDGDDGLRRRPLLPLVRHYISIREEALGNRQ